MMNKSSGSKFRLSKLDSASLRGAASLQQFELHKLAMQWSQCEPIVIHGKQDLKSTASWKDKLEPFEHQVQNLITFCRRLPVSIIADDVGLGKTISAGLILSELMVRQKVNRCLVVCTTLIGPQWVEELESKFGIEGRFESGYALRAAFKKDYPVVATTYDSARRFMREASDAGFDMLILDEAHKLRNLYGTKQPPKVAIEIKKALEDRIFKYVLMLTATPMQNRIWDLYSLIDCLSVAKGHENPLGNRAEFGARYARGFKQTGWSETDDGQKFRKVLRQYLVRTRRATVKLAFPQRQLQLRRAPATKHDKQLQEIGREIVECFYGGNGLIATSLGVAMMSSPHALQKQLHNMSIKKPGLLQIAQHVDDVVRDYETPSKLKALLEICEELKAANPTTWRLVVFTCRIETQHLIVRRMDDSGARVGVIKGGAPRENQLTIQEYSQEPPLIHVIVSTDAGAEGVNLQAGNVMVNYDLPWNPMVLEQRIGRVQRLGSKFENVVIFNLAVADSIEDRIVERLAHKLTEVSESVGDIESILEAGGGGKHDTFEAQLQTLVTKSLRGQDVAEQQRLAEENIVAAKQELQRHEHELDDQLGDLDELHRSGVRPPDLSLVSPDKTLREFVLMALREDGYTIEERLSFGPGTAIASKLSEGTEIWATFDRDTWRDLRDTMPRKIGRSRNQVELYQRGQPGVERLLQRWVNGPGAFVIDTDSEDHERASHAAAEWIRRCPGAEVAGIEILKTSKNFSGTVQVSTSAANGVDRYEKLVSCQVSEPSHQVDQSALQPETGRPVGMWQLGSDQEDRIQTRIEEDPDLNAFTSFYQARLAEELPRVGESEVRRRKVVDDFTVAHDATVVGSKGIEYSVCRCRVEIKIEEHRGYHAELVLVPYSGAILEEPQDWAECEQTKGRYPVEFLANCQLSNARVLRHILVCSDVSGRKALPKYFETCPRSGKTALRDEFAESSLSGKRAISSEFTTSEISSRLYLPEELTQCELTGAKVGQDEVFISELTQRKYRADQTATCSLTKHKGHISEFQKCDETGRLLTEDRLETSDFSGKRVHPDCLEVSARVPHRKGLSSEITKCEQTGQRLLLDEVGQCSFTNKTVDSTLLKPCEESGRLVCEDQLQRCEETGQLVSPSELETCGVTQKKMLRRLCAKSELSGRYARADLIQKCEITGAQALPTELLESQISKRKFRLDEAVEHKPSGIVGHNSEFVQCEYTGQMLLPNEVGISDVTGKRTAKSQLVLSAQSGRLGRPEECEECCVTQQTLMKDEVAKSAVSGLVAEKSLFRRSAVTGRLALENELIQCEVSGAKILPSESAFSSVSNKRVDARNLVTGSFSQDQALPDELVTCVVCGKRGVPADGDRCEKTGEWTCREDLVRCAVSNKLIRKDMCVVSEVSGRHLLKDLARRSFRSKQWLHPDEAVRCYWNVGWLAKAEAGKCRRTGLTFDRRLIADHEFKYFTKLMCQEVLGQEGSQFLTEIAAIPQLKRTKRAHFIQSKPKSPFLFFRLVVETRFRLGVELIGLVAKVEKDGSLKVFRPLTLQDKNKRSWTQLE